MSVKIPKDLQRAVEVAAQWEIEELLKRDELGKQNPFVKKRQTLDQALSLVKDIYDSDFLRRLPEGTQNATNNLIFSLVQGLFSIKNLDTNIGHEQAVNIVAQLNQQLAQASRQDVFGILGYALTRKMREANTLGDAIARTEQELAQSEAKAQGLVEQIESISVKSESVMKNIEEAAGRTALSVHSKFFSQVAEEHRTTAGRWMIATIGVSAATLVIGILFFVFNFSPMISRGAIDWFREIDYSQDVGKAVNHAISKLFVLSILSYAVYWCARNYRAHNHNAVVNNHRATSLKTFQAFADNTDGTVKNAVLMYATECIFSHQVSGYIHNEPESDPSGKMMQVFTDFSRLKPTS